MLALYPAGALQALRAQPLTCLTLPCTLSCLASPGLQREVRSCKELAAALNDAAVDRVQLMSVPGGYNCSSEDIPPESIIVARGREVLLEGAGPEPVYVDVRGCAAKGGAGMSEGQPAVPCMWPCTRRCTRLCWLCNACSLARVLPLPPRPAPALPVSAAAAWPQACRAADTGRLLFPLRGPAAACRPPPRQLPCAAHRRPPPPPAAPLQLNRMMERALVGDNGFLRTRNVWLDDCLVPQLPYLCFVALLREPRPAHRQAAPAAQPCPAAGTVLPMLRLHSARWRAPLLPRLHCCSSALPR